MPPERICHVAPWPLGGHLPDFDEHCRELVRAGLEVHTVCTGERLGRWSDPAAHPTVHGIALVRSALRWAFQASGVIRAIRPDLVHVYGFRGAGVLPLLDSRPKWIYDLRTGTIAKPWRAAGGNLASRLEAAPFDARITIHEALARRVWGSSTTHRVTVIPLGADFDRFRPFPSQAPERLAARGQFGFGVDDIVVVYVGALQPIRNPQRLLDVAARLRDVPNLRWLIVGYGSELDALRARVRDESLHFVQVRGRIDYDQIHEAYRAADIGFAYVPKIWVFDCQPPLKTIEMLAAGLPIVGTSTVGNQLFVNDGQNGLLAPDASDDLARALYQLVQDLGSFRQRVLADRPRLEQYSWRRIVRDRLLPLYRQVLRGTLAGLPLSRPRSGR